ncbi:diacylglycerol kinase [Sulfurimonas sp.]|uniref:diacylglycerol kinase n=1 Tax=Sulfurimonas sp. TaxID=2022749 RepID=UPI00261B3C6B|nr:diacylglycerol kinase [Sulfurimonas sp.]
MKLNKPKHNLYRNTIYALEGLVDIVKNETSFKWQLLMLFGFGTLAWILPLHFGYSSILFLSLFLPILAEIVNSAIERTVDLVTQDYHILAKQAKDVGATLVLVSFLVTVLIWIATLLVAFKLV